MLSSQHQHHQQFHQFQHQIPTATAALTAFCGAATATDFGSSNNSISSNNAAAATTTAVISSTYEPPSTLAPPQQQQLIGYGPGLLQQHHPPPISNSRQPQLQQPIQQLMINGGTLAKHHSPTMISSSSATGVTAQQPGAWFFPPAVIGGNGQQPHQQQGIMDHLSNGSPPSSPGLMAPHQLLARFGPRHCTESVEVPSSEHVAEIVGRQGCKIKALRAKTNTYIKTPVRGEEPVFVVTGRHEDVAEARREIECAAEHFTQIRASRRHSQGACPAPGHVTAYVRVPLRVVGLVVGPKGNTIKRIQQDTHTYIITPSREREPIFEVTGLPQNVEAARREIENHIYQRTGNMPITDQSASVANYDLHAAALQAQQSALGNHRPNYGALAVSTRNLMLSGGDQSMSPHLFQQQHQPNGCGINFGGGQHEFNNNIGTFRAAGHDYGKMMHFAGGGSERGASSPIQQFAMPNGGGGSHVPAASTNNLHMLLNALELENTGQEDKPNSAQIARIANGPQLLRSISNNAGRTKQQLQPTTRLGSSINAGMASAFSPWNSQSAGHGINASADFAGNGIGPTGGGGVDFLDLISSSPSQQLFPSSTGCQSSFSISSSGIVGNGFTGAVPGGAVGIGCGGGLSSVNSSSRDEGLGDSPTNSFGRPHGADAYQYQHLMNIWNDLVDQSPSTNAVGQQKVKSADAQGQGGEQKSTPAKETAETEVASG